MPVGVLRPSPWAIDDNIDRFKRGAPSSYGREKRQLPVSDLLRIAKPQAGKLKQTGAPWAVEEDNSSAFAKPANIIGAGIQFHSNFGDESESDSHKDAVRPQTKASKPPPSRGLLGHNQQPMTRVIHGGYQDGCNVEHPDESVICCACSISHANILICFVDQDLHLRVQTGPMNRQGSQVEVRQGNNFMSATATIQPYDVEILKREHRSDLRGNSELALCSEYFHERWSR
jgi:hypothetical protein